jgi:multidrug efflux system membrane fusion protein
MALVQNFGFLALALCLITTSCKPPAAKPPPPPKVTVSHPLSAVVTNWDEYPGHIEAVETVELRPRVAGYIESINFEDGAEVKEGDLLFVIDPKPYQAELDRGEAQRKQAGIRLELARNDLQRAEALRGTRALSDEEYDMRSKAVREAEGAVAAAQASEASARLNLDYTRITAPISGRIGRRLVTKGNLVQIQGNSGSTVLTTIVSIDPIYAYFDVEESAFLSYRTNTMCVLPGNGSGGDLTCELRLVTEPTFAHRGRLDFFDNTINPRTGTIRLRGVFANKDRALLPGMFTRLRVPASAPERALLVPEVAVLSDQGYKFVYVVNAQSKVEQRIVQTGRAQGQMRAVIQGLAPEDRVVVNGLVMIRPGIQVQAQDEPAKGAGTEQVRARPTS